MIEIGPNLKDVIVYCASALAIVWMVEGLLCFLKDIKQSSHQQEPAE